MLIRDGYKPKVERQKSSKDNKLASRDWRIYCVLSFFGVAFAILVGKAFFLQIKDRQFLISEGEKRTVRTFVMPALRGAITDRNGKPLAMSSFADSLYVIPSEAELTREQLDNLSALLEMPAEQILERSRRKSNVSILAERLNEETVAKIRALGIPDLKFRTDSPAGGRQTQELYVNPSKMKTLPDRVRLSKLVSVLQPLISDDALDAEVDELIRKMNKKAGFVFLKRQLDPELSQKIKDLGIKGLAFQQEEKRYYPVGEPAAQIVGFTNIDNKGQEGVELSRNRELTGTDGAKVVLRDNKGHVIEEIDSPKNQAAVNGRDIQLSIDQRIQVVAHDTLQDAVGRFKAVSGSIVVLDAQTGEVLAMANGPAYDSNHAGEADGEQRKNRAVIDSYEFGSVLKPLIVSKALSDGKINVNTHFSTQPYRIGRDLVRDAHSYQSLDVRGIIQKSSNVGTSKIAQKYSHREMYDFYRSIGFGQRTRAGLPGETQGVLPDPKKWSDIGQANMSFGYGLRVSLLQLAQSYTIFTTEDGRFLPATLEKLDQPPQGEQVLQPKTVRDMRRIMMSVTEGGGTGLAAAVDGFDVAGKTGTAQKVVEKNGKYVYSSEKHVATFVGFAPVQNPRLIVAVTLDEPGTGSHYGGTVAGPVFSKVMKESLNILGVQPTRPVKNRSDKG
ncbi:MAG: penicillin-binding protein 2 [Neisseria sp.]|nr:penicillin-binding protein 2 [Neisseria sp.]